MLELQPFYYSSDLFKGSTTVFAVCYEVCTTYELAFTTAERLLKLRRGKFDRYLWIFFIVCPNNTQRLITLDKFPISWGTSMLIY